MSVSTKFNSFLCFLFWQKSGNPWFDAEMQVYDKNKYAYLYLNQLNLV